jgi:hypothetical protein
MADNVVADAGAGGSTFAAASLSFSGDTVVVPGSFVGILSGSEGSWTFSLLVGGAGAVAAGVQRMTLASDDPAVVSLAIIDDWDESDRAKVNLIVGQAGIAAGAGAVGATVPRVTLASDDPGVALLTTIDGDTGNAVTALQLIDNVIYVDDADWTATTSSHALIGGIYQSTPGAITDGDTGPLRLTENGAAHVAIQNTVTVASHAVTNAGTFAVQVSSIAAGNNNIGDVDVASIVPGTGATNLGKAIDTATGGTDTGVLALATRDDALSALTPVEGDNVQLRTDANGALWVIPSGTVTVGTHAVTQSGTWTVDLGATDNAVLDSIDADLTTIIGHVDGLEGLLTTIDADTGTLAVVGNGAAAAALRVSLANDSTGIIATVGAVTAITNALPAGTNAIGKLAANSGVDIGDVDVTSISAGTNTIGNVGLIGRTSGGMTIFRSIDIDETEEEIKASAGQVFSIAAFNRTAAPLYLKFYNATAANVTVGTTTPVLTFVVPGNADSDGAGFMWNNDIGFAFGTAITVACTTGVADNDTGAPGANECLVNVGYT